LAQRYIDEWFAHVKALNLLPAHHYPQVSRTIPQIIALIQQLMAKGFAYTLDGDVFYRVRRFPAYGQLSGRDTAEALAGARVAVDERKEEAADFALWKAAKPGEPAWDTPWGPPPGRPGWHIECSAMALYYLGQQIDLHGGGNDLIFPHHENEIAQSEAVTGQQPFARYWLHNGLLQMRGEKMSKSLGNVVTIEEFLAQHPADVLRLIVLASHYRKPLSYDTAIVTSAEQGWRRLRNGLQPAVGSLAEGEAVEALRKQAAATRPAFRAALDDDFNTAGALGHLFTLVRAINTARDAGVGPPVLAQAQAVLRELAGVLGLELLPAGAESTADATALIEALVEVRDLLRQDRQWALADVVRDRLAALDIVLEDSPQGTKWRRQS
jgi:cysteinyl-tRNA synthetase